MKIFENDIIELKDAKQMIYKVPISFAALSIKFLFGRKLIIKKYLPPIKNVKQASFNENPSSNILFPRKAEYNIIENYTMNKFREVGGKKIKEINNEYFNQNVNIAEKPGLFSKYLQSNFLSNILLKSKNHQKIEEQPYFTQNYFKKFIDRFFKKRKFSNTKFLLIIHLIIPSCFGFLIGFYIYVKSLYKYYLKYKNLLH